MALRDLRFRLFGEDQGAGGAFDRVADRSERAGGKVSKFAVGIGTAVGGLAAGGISAGLGALSSFASGAVDAFAAIEDATGAAGVQFGNALPQVLAFADKAGASFGLSKRAALDAQNTFGTLGKAAGLRGADLAGFSGKLTGLAGDLASFKGTSTEQAIDAVGAALRGENEPLRAYGVLLDDATIKASALRLGLIKTEKDALSPANKTLAVQAEVFRQTADAQGDYARTSTSTANTAKTLAAETENAQAKLGAKLAPAVTLVRRAFLGLIKGSAGFLDLIGPGLDKLTPLLSKVGSGVGGLFKALAPSYVKIVRSAFDGLRGAFDGIAKTVRENEGELRELGRTLGSIGKAAATVLGPVVKVAFRLLGEVIARGVKNVALIVTAFNAVREPVSAVFRFLVEAFLGVVGGIVDGAARAFGWVPGLGPKLKTAAGEFRTFAEQVNANLDALDRDRVIQLRVTKVDEAVKSGALSVSEAGAAGRAARGGGRPSPMVVPTPRRPVASTPSRNNRELLTTTTNLVVDGQKLATVVNRQNINARRNGAELAGATP